MYTGYVSSYFHNGFYENLKRLEKSECMKLITMTINGHSELHFPFTLHFFAGIYGYKLKRVCHIDYLTEDILNLSPWNPLYTATKSDIHSHYRSFFKLNSSEQEDFITNTKKQMLMYEFLYITKEDSEQELNKVISSIEKVRIILLTVS